MLPDFPAERFFFQTAEGDQITDENVETKTYNWFGSKGAGWNKQRIALNRDRIKWEWLRLILNFLIGF